MRKETHYRLYKNGNLIAGTTDEKLFHEMIDINLSEEKYLNYNEYKVTKTEYIKLKDFINSNNTKYKYKYLKIKEIK